jgi:ADP-ribosyl-[dinitrogen reductase] hydrolase
VTQPIADCSPTKASRLAGCLVGGAVGDALGAPVEFLSHAEIAAKFGPEGITGYEPAYGRRGAITDDTQMTLFTVEGLMRGLRRSGQAVVDVPAAIHRAYLSWLHTQGEPQRKDLLDGWLVQQRVLHNSRSAGLTTLGALRTGRMGTVEQPLNDSKGCGAVTRVAPLGIVGEEAFDLAVKVAAITHGHPTGYLGAGAFAAIMATVLCGGSIDVAIEGARDRLRQRKGHREVLAAIDAAVNLAKTDPQASLERLGTGWVAEEALAISLFCALTAPDFAAGVLRAVNHGGESNNTGAMTGSILGALRGRGAIPEQWVAELEARAVIEQVGADLVARFVGGGSEDDGRYPG